MNTLDQSITYKKPWFRKISRTVRPFKYSNALLANALFRLNDIEDFSDSQSVSIDGINLESLAPEFKINLNNDFIGKQLGVNSDLLSLIVSANDNILKRTNILFSAPLKNIKVDENNNYFISLESSKVNSISWTTKTKITLAIVLHNSQETKVGQAYLAGHWLSRKDFSITESANTPKFNFKIIKPEQFKEFNLPTSTSYYIKIVGDDLNVPRENFQEIIEVYISEPINNFLAKNDNSLNGIALSHMIGYDLAATILSYGFSNLDDDQEISEDSILFTAAHNLSKEVGIDLSLIKAWAKEPGATRLRALFQSHMNLTKALLRKE